MQIFSSKRSRNLIALIILFWLLMIFYFSSQRAVYSDRQSLSVANFFAGFLNISLPENIDLHFLTRKLAHLFEYFVLGILFYLFLCHYNHSEKVKICFSFLAAVLCGALDEIHQFFVPGRTARVFDVAVDGMGALAGICAVLLIVRAIVKRQR